MIYKLKILVIFLLMIPAIDTLFANEDLQNQLGKAVYEGSVEKVRQLIKEGVDVNQGASHNQSTPLGTAIRYQHPEIIRLLVEAGANVNQEDNRGRSLLMQAIINRKPEMAAILLELGADPGWVDRNNKDALDYLFSRKQPDQEIANLLIDAGANINRVRGAGSLLQMACDSNDLQLVRSLLDKGAEPNIADPLGRTPLFTAVSAGNQEMVKLLVDGGADLSVKAMNLSLPQMAEIKQNMEMVNLLQTLSSNLANVVNNSQSGSMNTNLSNSVQKYQNSSSSQRTRADNPSSPEPAPPGLFAYKIPGNPDPKSGGLYISSKPDLKQGEKCSGQGEIGSEGIEQMIGYRLYEEQGRAVGVSGETVYLPKGRYRLVKTQMETPWKWVCSGVAGATTKNVNTSWSLHKEKTRTSEHEQWVSLGGSNVLTEPPEE